MKIEILGSGGAITTPRPGCDCEICVQARIHGRPFERTGPSVFVHDLKLLIDTPEESKYQLNRADIRDIKAGLYSHWHPDHTAGSRMWESFGRAARIQPLQSDRVPLQTAVPIYVPSNAAAEWPVYLGLTDKFKYLEHIGAITFEIVAEQTPFQIEQSQITPITLWEEYVSAFLLEDGQKRVFIAMDELHNWQPPKLIHDVDLAIMPMGIPQYHPLTKATIFNSDHWIFHMESTFEQTIAMVRTINPRRVVFMHIEEVFGLDPAELERIAYHLQLELGFQVNFAYDGMQIHI